MKSSFAPLLSALVLAFAGGGCEKIGPAADAPAPDEKVLFAVVEDNAKAFNNKDVDAVMATIHSKAPNVAGTKQFIADTFKDVTLKVTLSDLKVVTSKPEEARVSFKQKTEQMTPEGLKPLNIVEGVHTLRPDDGKWKITGTVNTNVTRLNQPAEEAPTETAPAPAPDAPAPEAAPAPDAAKLAPTTEKPAQ